MLGGLEASNVLMVNVNGLAANRGQINAQNAAEGRERCARENHSEIERRRRNKMTHYINELADMVPQCAALGRKPDKLTILRMAVSHMKSIRAANAVTDGPKGNVCQPSFLTDNELKHLMLEAANGFLFVLSCDDARVLYVADSIYPILNISEDKWMNHSFYDLIHPDDVEKVRDQLCGNDLQLARMVDIKTGTIKRDQGAPRVHLNCRRGFICRMQIGDLDCLPRLRNRGPIYEHSGHFYAVMHCTGYVKSTPPLGISAQDSPNPTACLVAIARLQLTSLTTQLAATNSNQFTLRIDKEGYVTFVDQKAQELLNKPIGEMLEKRVWTLVHPMDEQLVNESFKTILRNNQHQIKNLPCKWQSIGSADQEQYVGALLDAHAFINPHSRELEYIIATVNLQRECAAAGLIDPKLAAATNYRQTYFAPPPTNFNHHTTDAASNLLEIDQHPDHHQWAIATTNSNNANTGTLQLHHPSAQFGTTFNAGYLTPNADGHLLTGLTESTGGLSQQQWATTTPIFMDAGSNGVQSEFSNAISAVVASTSSNVWPVDRPEFNH